MNLAVIGTGYVGLVSAACFADLGHTVIGMDIDKKKIRTIQSGKSPIYEPGLEEVLNRGLASGRLSFTADLKKALKESTVVFSAVATPPNKDFSADLKNIFVVCENIANIIDHDIVFVQKSTVPIGTGTECEKRMAAILKKRGEHVRIPVISNPEFLREGCAVGDTMKPDRIVIGINEDDTYAQALMEEIYKPLTRVGKPLLVMSRESAEVVKYASNAFLATKISFVNMFTELCEQKGANIRDIARGMGLDERIGPRFLHAGIGYGGSCFPKDVKALIALSRESHIPLPIIDAVHDINEKQRKRFIQKIVKSLPPKGTVALWGLSFKPKTDDMREAPSITVISALLQRGHAVRAYDPVAMGNAKKLFPKHVLFSKSPLAAAKGADATVLLTEWDIFRGIDLRDLANTMKGKHLFDGRNVYEPKDVEREGLIYH